MDALLRLVLSRQRTAEAQMEAMDNCNADCGV